MHHCKIEVISNSNHIQQVYCGLEELARRNVIHIEQTFDTNSDTFISNIKNVPAAQSSRVKLTFNHSIKVFIDLDDNEHINEEGLLWCRYYYKRSFNKTSHSKISNRIQAFGLNYMVKPNFPSIQSLLRIWHMSVGKERLKGLIRELDIFNWVSYQPLLKDLFCLPQNKLNFKILFICRLWEPTQDDYFSQSEQQVADRISINQMRVSCLKILKREFGEQFVGGLVPTAYAMKNHKELVFVNKELTNKKNYLNFLKDFSICISTAGLSNSTGWKFAEYLAFSKGIVSEKLHFDSGKGLEKNKHYFEFNSPEECVFYVKKLRNNHQLLNEMQHNNRKYYQEHLHPEQLMLNVINSCIN